MLRHPNRDAIESNRHRFRVQSYDKTGRKPFRCVEKLKLRERLSLDLRFTRHLGFAQFREKM